MKKRILIKASLIHPNKNGFIPGIGRANVELINALLSLNDPLVKFSCYCIGRKSIKGLPYKWDIKYYFFPVWGKLKMLFDLWLEPFFRKYLIGYDLLHLTGNYDGVWACEKFVITIHDLIQYDLFPETRSRFLKSAKCARAIITCSEYSKQEIVRILNVPSDKVHVIYWGINHDLFYKRCDTQVNAVLLKYGVNTPYFFSCLGVDPTNRKNTDITMAAFRLFIQTYENYTLVLTWSACPNYLFDEYSSEIENGKIKILKGVSDEELACLYTGALASYFISSAEGFGFPILESFACGTPCVTCRNTSLTEIGTDKAVFVKERDVDGTLATMCEFAQRGKKEVDSLVEYAKTFSWENTAREYLNVYKQILAQ